MQTRTTYDDAETSVPWRIELLQERHIPSLAAAHVACFDGYFLTNLGTWFLGHYYRNYLESDEGAGVVAVDASGRVVAFATGTSDLTGQDARLMKTRFAVVVWAVARAAIVNGSVRRQVLGRLSRIGKIVARARTLPANEPTVPASTAPRTDAPRPTRLPAVTLTSLGVLPEHRGSGLSTAIVESFEREVRRRGFRRVRASTGFDNARSRAFYEKIGWVVEQSREDQNGIDFERVFTD